MSYDPRADVGVGTGSAIDDDTELHELPHTVDDQFAAHLMGCPYKNEPQDVEDEGLYLFSRDYRDNGHGDSADMFNLSCLGQTFTPPSAPNYLVRPGTIAPGNNFAALNDERTQMPWLDTTLHGEMQATERYKDVGWASDEERFVPSTGVGWILEGREHSASTSPGWTIPEQRQDIGIGILDTDHGISWSGSVEAYEPFETLQGRRPSLNILESMNRISSPSTYEDFESHDGDNTPVEQRLYGSAWAEAGRGSLFDTALDTSSTGESSIDSIQNTRFSRRHEGISLECPECGQSYHGPHRRGTMHRHMRLRHASRGSDKDYFCEAKHCGKSFRRQDARLKHYRKQHPELGTPPAMLRGPVHTASSEAVRRRSLSSTTTVLSENYIPSPTSTVVIGSSRQGDRCERLSLVGNERMSAMSGPKASDIDRGSIGEGTPEQSGSDTEDDRTSTRNDERNTCDACGKTFRRLADLRRHSQKHEEPKFMCDVSGCERAFYRIDKLRDHVRQTHKGTISTTDSGSLRIEVGEEAPKTVEKSFLHSCKECDSSFETEGQLNSHINRKHVKRFACDKCDRAFALRADLLRHHKAKHGATAQTLFQCTNTNCSRTFMRKDHLLRHTKRCNQSLGKEVDEAQ